MNRAKINSLEKKYYHDKTGWKNGTEEFHEILDSLIPPKDAILLEIGPGPVNQTSDFLAGKCKRLDGLDIDERALTNPALKKAYIYDGKEFPDMEVCYDLIIADYVMEHVEFPQIMLNEVAKILKPGGAFLFRTPNVYHYVSLISKFSPHKFHLAVANKSRLRGDHDIDPYPTFYRLNSRHNVNKFAKKADLIVTQMKMIEKEPGYLKFHPWAYKIGVLYERIVNSSPIFNVLRSNMFCVLVKPN